MKKLILFPRAKLVAKLTKTLSRKTLLLMAKKIMTDLIYVFSLKV